MTAATPHLRIVRRSLDHPDAALLVAEVQAEYALLYGNADNAPIDPDEFEGDAGTFLVAYLGDTDEFVGTAAWRRIPTPAALGGAGRGGAEQAAEVKRMYVRRPFRRQGLARVLLAAVEESAREAGVRWAVLETGDKQPEAIALYRSSGYVPLEGFGHYAHTGRAYAFARDLGARGAPSRWRS